VFSDDIDDPQTITLSETVETRASGRIVATAHQTVEIPEQYFGKPLTGGLKWWVEWVPRTLLRRRLIDECDQRRWLMFAFTAQPFIFPLPYLFRALLYLGWFLINAVPILYYGVMLGYRGIDYDAFLKGELSPVKIRQSVKKAGRSSMYEQTGDGVPYFILRQLLQPATLLLVLGVWLLMTPTLLVSMGVAMVVLLVSLGSAVFLLRTIGRWFAKRSYRKKLQEMSSHERERRAKAAEEAKRAAARAADVERMRGLVSDLACPLIPVVASYDRSSLLRPAAIPLRHRTLQLHYEAIKSKVCRPLSRY
jgi:hypothetical protein